VLGGGVPASVRTVVSGRVAEWRGEVPADDAWLGGASSGLADGEVAVGRLALSAAFAPGRVDPVLVDVVRERWGERVLVEVVAWAAFEAARRIGTLLAPDAGSSQEDEAKVIQFRRRNPSHRPLSAPTQRRAKL
jgi:hypothetical protein